MRIKSLLAVVALLTTAACSDSTPTPVADSGSTATPDSGGGASDAATASDAPAVAALNGCTSALFAANDLTPSAAARTITFPTGLAPAQYSPPCITIKAGQMVTFTGSFTSHPLAAEGGDAMSPIVSTKTGTTASFTFAKAGTFGYKCEAHPSSMLGAIHVVP